MADMWMEGERYKIKGVPDRVKLNQLANLLHDALISTEHVDSCAIIDRKEKEQRAASPGFTMQHDQIITIQDAFKKCATIRKEGFLFGDKSYICVRADRNSIYAKTNNEGLIVARTNTLIIVAMYSDKMLPSVCVEAVEKLAEYFREKGR